MTIIRTSSFSNIPVDRVGKEILERVFNYHLEPPSEDPKSSFLVQYDQNNNVEVLVKLAGWSKLRESQFESINRQLTNLIVKHHPQVVILLVFEFLEGELASKLTESINRLYDKVGHQFNIYDIDWISSRLKEYPDIEEKYSINLNKDNPKLDLKEGFNEDFTKENKSNSNTSGPNYDDIKSEISEKDGRTFWWFFTKDRKLLQSLKTGDSFRYRAFGDG